MEQLLKKVRKIIEKNRKKKWTKAGLMSIACLIVFATTYSLILPAITISLDQADQEPGFEVATAQGELLDDSFSDEDDEQTDGSAGGDGLLNGEGDASSLFDEDDDEIIFSDGDGAGQAASDEIAGPFKYTYTDAETAWEITVELLDGAVLPADTQLTAKIVKADPEKENDVYPLMDKAYRQALSDAGYEETAEPVFYQLVFEKDDEKLVTGDTYAPARVSFRFYEEVPGGDVTAATGECSRDGKEAKLQQTVLIQEKDGYSLIADLENAADMIGVAKVRKAETAEEAETAEAETEGVSEGETAAEAESASEEEPATEEAAESITEGAEEEDETEGTESVSEDAAEDATEADSEQETESITEDVNGELIVPLTYEGQDYSIRLTYGADAEIPADAYLDVREIEKGSDEYQMYLAASGAALESEGKANGTEPRVEARFFDITIMSGGEKVEPKGAVSVDISYNEALPVAEDGEVNAVHFEDGAETATVLEATPQVEEGEVSSVSFDTDSFSVFGIVYTVDFAWEVNGKVYEFSLPGGGFVSFEKLMEVLGVAENNEQNNSEENSAKTEEAQNNGALSLNNVQVSEKTKQFVADVEKVEFSSPDLVWVHKVESDTTVGSLKNEYGLECQYSAELTEEDIAAINSQRVEGGDWTLISVLPFRSEENLTVTMKHGDQFVVKVTDGQMHTYVISDSGDTYKVIVTYDDTAEIPEDAELRVREIKDTEENYTRNIDASNRELQLQGEPELVHPVQFDIAIVSGGEEVEPKEGSIVNVEIRLAKFLLEEDVSAEENSAAEEEMGMILFNGQEIALDSDALSGCGIAHIAEDGTAEIIEDVESSMTDDKIVMQFETESFSDYLFDGNNGNGLYNLPSTIYVGDEIYMWNQANYWVSDINSVVTETKANNSDNHKTVTAINTGTFRIYNRYNPNGEYREIRVLPARTGTTPPATIDTINNASIGLTLNLFDYDLNGSLDSYFNGSSHNDNPLSTFAGSGINSGNALKFWGSGIGNNYGSLNQYVEHGVTSIVNTNLNSAGYPVLSNNSGGSGNGDLSYLFTPSNGTDKIAYTNVNGLFKKDGDYYVYDSNQNYAWYNPSTNSFDVYNSTYYQHSGSETGGYHTPDPKPIGFFPFHPWDNQYDLYVNWNKNLNHHFGMSMSVPFSLPKDPKAVVDTDGEPIIFEFSGDDDLWVFIDGKLAMDIGGIHQPTSGTINFRDGTVTANSQNQTGFDFSNLYDGKKHTLQVFYIERGGCDSNCMIKFNLTQYGEVHFDKVDKENPSDKLAGAVFGIYKNESCTEPLMEQLKSGVSRAYVAESDANGHVQFSDIPLGTYYLKELHAPEGYPLDNTVHTVRVYIEDGEVKVTVTIDGTDVANGVNITNKKPDPISLGLKKEWQNADEQAISAPDGVTATFEIKRIRTYETYTEQVVEGQGREVSHLTVGWIHNGETHVYGEYDLIAESSATVSWGYRDGYTGSKDCIINGTRIDKDYVSNNVVSERFSMPGANGSATFYIIDDSDAGDAIRSINIAGQQFYGNSGGGVIHIFQTIKEPDPDFNYTGDHVTDNKVTLPINESTWQYIFNDLPTFGRGNVTGVNHEVAFNYSYYLEEVSNTAPAGTTVIYKDLSGNVINAPMDAETSVSRDETIINRIPFGYLKIKKEVTYNGSSENLTAEQKSKLAGTYKFKIYTKQQCGVADAVQDPNAEPDAEDKDLIITITIGENGQAVSSDAIKLLAGNYWIKEVESSNPAMFPVHNPCAVTVTKDQTTNDPVITSLTNNYDENNGPDKIALDIEKKFVGLDASSQVPSSFMVTLQYKIGGQIKTVTLRNTQLATGENDEKITWTQNEDGFTWHWKVTNIPSEAEDFKIKEENHDNATGYHWISATLNGSDITSFVTNYHDLMVTAPKATLSDVTKDRRTSDSGQNTMFYLYDDDILLTKLTANQGTLVISKHPLNLAERDAVVKGWPEQGGFKTPPHYFSIEEHPNGFSYGDKTVTFGEKDGKATVKFTQNASAQEAVFAVSYSSQDARNNANLVNTYEEIPITIDIVKVDEKDTSKKLPGAVFTLRQIADKAPNNGMLETLNGTIDSDPTNGDGKTSFSNLTHGYYEISEKTAPDGYVLSEKTTFYFKIESGVVKWLVKGTNKPSEWVEKTEKAEGEMVDFEQAHAAVEADPEHNIEAQDATNAVFKVENEPGAALPSTGGSGINMFYLLGITLISLAAGAGLLIKRRRGEAA